MFHFLVTPINMDHPRKPIQHSILHYTSSLSFNSIVCKPHKQPKKGGEENGINITIMYSSWF